MNTKLNKEVKLYNNNKKEYKKKINKKFGFLDIYGTYLQHIYTRLFICLKIYLIG